MLRKTRCERAEIMLEGMIIMIMTMFILIWVLGVGFLYYQRYLVTAVTNDIAVKIASTYNNPDSDLIMGYITAEELSERSLYRGFQSGNLHDVNEDKSIAYVTYMLEKTNFSGTVKDIEVKLNLVADSPVRKHIEIETRCTFNTPFNEVFSMFGMDELVTYASTARADCTDLMDYYSTVEFASFLTSDQFIETKGEKTISSVISMINSLMDAFNHIYKKS